MNPSFCIGARCNLFKKTFYLTIEGFFMFYICKLKILVESRAVDVSCNGVN